jgi:hypothetical protein
MEFCKVLWSEQNDDSSLLVDCEIPPRKKGFMWEHLVRNEVAAVTQHADAFDPDGLQACSE